MASRPVSVRELAIRAREMSDMQRTNFITDEEIIRYISNEYCDMYDLLTTRYTLYYANPIPFQITMVANQEIYALPGDFYKMAGIEREDGGGKRLSLYPFNFTERNVVSTFSLFETRYCITGDEIMFKNVRAGTVVYLYYIPSPKELDKRINIDSVDASADTFTLASHGFAQGDFLYVQGVHLPGGITAGQKYYVVNPTTDTFQVSLLEDDVALDITSTGSGVIKVDWYGQGCQIGGISGWDELVVIGTAIRMMDKEESDTRSLVRRREELKDRIAAASQSRDVGNAPTVTDIRSILSESDWPFNLARW